MDDAGAAHLMGHFMHFMGEDSIVFGSAWVPYGSLQVADRGAVAIPEPRGATAVLVRPPRPADLDAIPPDLRGCVTEVRQVYLQASSRLAAPLHVPVPVVGDGCVAASCVLFSR